MARLGEVAETPFCSAVATDAHAEATVPASSTALAANGTRRHHQPKGNSGALTDTEAASSIGLTHADVDR